MACQCNVCNLGGCDEALQAKRSMSSTLFNVELRANYAGNVTYKAIAQDASSPAPCEDEGLQSTAPSS